MNLPDDFQHQLDHLIWMCDLGQKHYAWNRAKEIERDDKSFKGLCEALTKQMKERNENKEMQSVPK